MNQTIQITEREQKTIDLVNSYIRDLEREKGNKQSLKFERRNDGSYLLFKMNGEYRTVQPMIYKNVKELERAVASIVEYLII